MKNHFFSRSLFSTVVIAFAVLASSCQTNTKSTSNNNRDAQWIASWGASPFAGQAFGPSTEENSLEELTVRQILRLSVGGDQVRIRFSNAEGNVPLTIGSASVAIVESGSSVKANTIHPLSFGGKTSIVIPPGAPALSDPVALSVEALTELAVSMYFPEATTASTVHGGRIAYISSTGDFTKSATLADARQDANMIFLTGAYVSRRENTRVFVTLGDSITDGTASTPFSFNSWPDHFAQRLNDAGIDNLAVVNHGISGNQVLRNGAGISALARFDRDVLATPGLTHIVVMEGINDIGSGGMTFFNADGSSSPITSAADIIAGYQQLINRTHSKSPALKIFGATLTPFEGTFEGYYTPEKDETRREVNQWIRNSGAFDGVIDFDKAIQDPQNPNIMKAEYNSGDSLHPGDLGYEHMADSIDISLFD